MNREDGLPKGWVFVRLHVVATINPEKLVPDAQPDEPFNFVPMSSVTEEFGGIEISTLRPFAEVQRGYTQFRSGDVISAKITPCMENGKIAVVPELDNVCAYGSTEFHVLRPRMGISSKWIAYYLLQSRVRRDAKRNMSGSAGQLRVPRPWIEGLAIPIAPSPEQLRIVAKIEELFSDLDAGVAALQRAKAKLKRYRAAVLKAAVEGRLTEQWRAEHPAQEPASELLERILKERRKKWEENQLAAYEAKGRQPPKNWQKKYQEPAGPNTANLPKLPDGWCWATVEQLGKVQLGRQRSPKNRSKDYPTPYIRAANLTEAGLNLSDVLDMEFKPSEVESYRLAKGDIVVSEASGSPDQVGKPAVWNDELPGCCFQNTVIRLRPHRTSSSEFLLTVFRHCYFNKIFAKIAAGVGINHLSAAKFARIAIPLLPEDEQTEVVAEVERRLSILAQTETLLIANLRRSARLRQSILKRAFEGKLVPQDPTDEPASLLLERIKTAAVDSGTIKGNRKSAGNPRRRVAATKKTEISQ